MHYILSTITVELRHIANIRTYNVQALWDSWSNTHAQADILSELAHLIID